MLIPALLEKDVNDPSGFLTKRFDRTINKRAMSPLVLYLYLKPLYSRRGGSTTRAEPFTKKPGFVTLR